MEEEALTIASREQALHRLGLKGSPNRSEIKKAYRKLALVHHPDKYSTEEERAVADEGFRRLGEARDYLVERLRVETDIAEGEDAVPRYRKAGWSSFRTRGGSGAKRPVKTLWSKVHELRVKIYCVLVAVVAVWFFSWLYYFRFVYESPGWLPGSERGVYTEKMELLPVSLQGRGE